MGVLTENHVLRPRCERPRGRRAAEQRDEVAAPHVGHEPSSRRHLHARPTGLRRRDRLYSGLRQVGLACIPGNRCDADQLGALEEGRRERARSFASKMHLLHRQRYVLFGGVRTGF